MSITPIRVGPYQIFLSVDNGLSLPSLQTLTWQACAVNSTSFLNNSSNQPLSTSDTYQVMLGLLGIDKTNGGYTIGYCSPGSGTITVGSTTGEAPTQVIQARVSNAAWPADFDSATAVACFLKINSAQFQLAGYGYMDPSSDFTHIIKAKPLRVAPRFSTTLLQSTTADSILGDRTPKGVSWVEITPTSGECTFRRPVTNITISPNTSPDFQISTGRGSGLRFQSLVNDIKAFVRAAAGLYAKITDTNGDVVEEAEMSLATAQAIFRGNRGVQVFLPPDQNGNQEVRLLLGLLTFNQIELTEAWSKTAPCLVQFQFDPAVLDTLIVNQHTEIDYIRRTS